MGTQLIEVLTAWMVAGWSGAALGVFIVGAARSRVQRTSCFDWLIENFRSFIYLIGDMVQPRVHPHPHPNPLPQAGEGANAGSLSPALGGEGWGEGACGAQPNMVTNQVHSSLAAAPWSAPKVAATGIARHLGRSARIQARVQNGWRWPALALAALHTGRKFAHAGCRNHPHSIVVQ